MCCHDDDGGGGGENAQRAFSSGVWWQTCLLERMIASALDAEMRVEKVLVLKDSVHGQRQKRGEHCPEGFE